MAGVRTIAETNVEGFASYSANSTSVATTTTTTTTTATQSADVFFQMQQVAVGKQISDFGDAVERLNSKLRVFSSSGMFQVYYKKSGSGDGFNNFVRNSLRSLVDAYNNVNKVMKSSGYITDEGARIFNDVQALLQGKNSEDYLAMGLKVDKNSGSIKLDEQKLVSYLTENTAQAKKLLVDKGYLAPKLQNIVQNVLGKTEGYYFCRPFSAYV